MVEKFAHWLFAFCTLVEQFAHWLFPSCTLVEKQFVKNPPGSSYSWSQKFLLIHWISQKLYFLFENVSKILYKYPKKLENSLKIDYCPVNNQKWRGNLGFLKKIAFLNTFYPLSPVFRFFYPYSPVFTKDKKTRGSSSDFFNKSWFFEENWRKIL